MFEKDDTANSIEDDRQHDVLSDEDSTEPTSPATFRSRKRKSNSSAASDTDQTMFHALAATSQLPEECADMSFLKSLIPSIKQLTEDQRLDFRIGVLQLLKNIKKEKS